MKYLKTYESIYDQVKPYLIEKFVVIKDKHINKYFLLEITPNTFNVHFVSGKVEEYIKTNKLYTLNANSTIRKNKQQNYNIKVNELDTRVIYKSSNIQDSYDVMASIHDAEKYNIGY